MGRDECGFADTLTIGYRKSGVFEQLEDIASCSCRKLPFSADDFVLRAVTGGDVVF
jgi:hypothetical protein